MIKDIVEQLYEIVVSSLLKQERNTTHQSIRHFHPEFIR
mgnify:CR=1 FL=1